MRYEFMKQTAPKNFSENRRARFDYETLESYQGGLVLTGSEVKSTRDGGMKLTGAHIAVMQGELWLIGAHISKYVKSGGLTEYDPDRRRKILVRKKELLEISGKSAQKGLTLAPFSVYPSGRQIKLSFGLVRGKKSYDKRESLKKRDLDRTVQRALRGEDVG